MMQAQPELRRLSSANLLFPSSLSPSPFSRHLNFPKPTNYCTLCSAHRAWLAHLSEQVAAAAASSVPLPEEEVGPIEIPSAISSLLAASEDPSTIQTGTSVLLTAAFTVILFRSLRRRAKRAKETRLRSSGAKKSLKEEALQSLKKTSNSAIKAKSPPSADQAFLGALIAAAFGLLLYKFTTTVEYNLNHQVLSNNYSVRQITITIRTIINGLCYLATFVFGFNSLGLFLYSGQLALNSFVDVPTSDHKVPLNTTYPKLPDSNNSDDQSSDKKQK